MVKYRVVLQNVGENQIEVPSIWVDDVHEAISIGERGLEFYGGTHYILEEGEDEQ